MKLFVFANTDYDDSSYCVVADSLESAEKLVLDYFDKTYSGGAPHTKKDIYYSTTCIEAEFNQVIHIEQVN